ncbi:hypothetical protein H5410_058873 [Solanum commersonii]|uniref:Uncharacterized protein n=1 Tax=Solanum commersonii TaxID=4109 RepID=A0A9J5W0T8_SOLCO|nr:hypothetical protein H5410_058873 [Solanum commersonii]
MDFLVIKIPTSLLLNFTGRPLRLPMERLALQRSKWPIFRLSDHSDLTYGAVGPRGKSGPFSGQAIPGGGVLYSPWIFGDQILTSFCQNFTGRPLRPYLWSQLALTAKTDHFQGQTIPGADLTYGAVGPHGQASHFQGQAIRRRLHGIFGDRIRPHFAKILLGRPLRPYLWSGWPSPKMAHFIRSKRSLGPGDLIYGASWPSRGKWPIFKVKEIPGGDVKTLPMERPIGPHGQKVHFQGQAIHGRVCYSSPFFGDQNFRPHFCQILLRRPWSRWPKTILGQSDPKDPIEISPHGRPLSLWSQLALRKAAHFQGQAIPGDPYSPWSDQFVPKFLPLRPHGASCKATHSVHGFFEWPCGQNGELKFDLRPFSRPKRRSNDPRATLPMELVGPHGQNGPFSRSNDPRGETLPMEPVGPHGQNGPFSRSNDPRSRIRPHFCQNFTGRPLRPYLWSQLALTAKTTHFKGQMIPEARWPKAHFQGKAILGILPIFNSDLIFAKILLGRPLRPYLRSAVEFRPHFCQNFTWTSVKTLPMELVGPHGQNDPFSRSKIPGSPWIFGDPEFDLIFAKILPGRPLRPYLWSQLALTDQNGPFSRSNDPGAKSMEFLVIQNSRPHFCQNFTWTSVKTLPMEPVGPHSQNGPFSRSNDPGRVNHPFCQFLCAIVHGIFGDPDFRPHFCQNITYKSVKTLSIEPVVNGIFGDPEFRPHFCQNFTGHPLRPYLWSQLALTAKMTHFQGQMIPEPYLWSQLAITAKTTHFQGQMIPEKSNFIFAKILLGHPPLRLTYGAIGPPAKSGPFSRSSDPRDPSGAPYLWSGWSWPKRHFSNPYFAKDLTYGASWPSRPKRPIFKVKELRSRRPLRPYLWSQLALTAKTAYFLGQTIPREDYLWSQLALTAKTAHFQGQMIPGAVNGIFGDPKFRTHFCQNFTSTSVKTLPMEPVGLHGQNGPFLRSTIPRVVNEILGIQNSNPIFAKILPRRPSRPYLWSQLALTTKTAHFLGQTIPGAVHEFFIDPEFRPHLCQNITWTYVKTLPIDLFMNFLVIWNYDRIFAKSLPGGPLRPYLWSHLTLTAKPAYFQGQTKPGVVNGIFGDPELCPHFCQNFAWTSVNTLPIEPIVPHGQNGPFSRTNDQRSSPWISFEIQNSDLIFSKILPGRPLRPYLWNQLALTAKTAHFQGQMIPEKSNLIFAKILHGCPLIPYLWSQLALTAKTAYFQGQTIPVASKPPFCQCSCPIVNGIFGDLEFRPHFCQNITWTSVRTLPMEPVGPLGQNRPFYRSNDSRSGQLALTAKMAYFLGQTIPREGKPPFCRFSCAISMEFLVIQNSDLIFAKILPGCPLGPYLWIQLSLTGKPAHFKVKRSPEQLKFYLDIRKDLTYGASWPSRPKRPTFKNSNLTVVKMLPGRPSRPYLWSQLALMEKSTQFQCQTIPEAGRLLIPYLWSQLALIAKTTHFQGQTIPGAGKPPILSIFVSMDLLVSVNTLPMELVRFHEQNGPFLRSTDPQSRHSLRPNLWSQLALMAKIVVFQGQRSPEQDSNFIFVKILRGRPLGPHLWCQWTPSDKTVHFKGQTILEASKPPILSIFVCIVNGIFGDQNSNHIFAKILPGLQLRPYLWSQLALANLDLIFAIILPGRPLKPDLWSQLSLTAKTAHFKIKMILEEDLTYGANFPLRPKRPIFKVKRSPEQNSDLIFAKILLASPLGPYLWSQLTLTAKTAHFQVNEILVIQKSYPIFTKILPRRPSRPYLRSLLALTAKTTHFLGQTIPGADFIYEASRPSRPKETIFKVKRCPVQDLTYGANWPSRPKRPIFKVKQTPEQPKRPILKVKRSPEQLVLTAKTAHFQGQMIPGAVNGIFGDPKFCSHFFQNFTYGANWPSQLKWPILKNSNLIFAKILPVRSLRRPMEPVGPHGQNAPFLRSNDPWSRIPTPYLPKFYLDVHQDLTYAASWLSQPKRPIFWVKRFLEQSMNFLVIWNFDCIFAKIIPGGPLKPLPMEPLDPHGQNGPFSGSKEPRVDLTYGDSYPSWLKRPIFKVKQSLEQSIKTLFIEPVSQNGPFSRLNDPRINGIFGDPEFRPHFCQNFSSTSVNTLPIDTVFPHGKNDPFSRSNDHRSRPILWNQLALTAKTTHFQDQTIPEARKPLFCRFSYAIKSNLIFAKILPECPLIPYTWSQLALTTKTAHFQGQTIPGAIGPHNQNGPFSRSNDPRSRIPTSFLPKSLKPYLSNQLALTAKMTHFQSQMIPGTEVRPHFCQKFSWTSVNTLPMEPVGPHGQNNPFQGQTIPGAGKPPILPIFVSMDLLTLHMEPVGLHGQNGPFSTSIDPQIHGIFGDIEFLPHFCNNLTWTSVQTISIELVGTHSQNDPFSRSNDLRRSWPSWPKWPFSSQRSPKQSMDFLVIRYSDLIFAKILPGLPLRPYLRANWPLRLKRLIFKVKRSPEQNFDPIFAKNLPRHPSRPYLWSQLDLTAKTAHFLAQMFPGAEFIYEASRPSRPKESILKVKQCLVQSMEFLVIHNSCIIFAKTLPGRPLGPYLWSPLALTAIMAYSQGQTNPGANLTYVANWPLRPKCPIFKVKRSPEQPVGPHSQNGPFSRLNDPRKFQPHFCINLQTLSIESVGTHGQNDPFSKSNDPQISQLALMVKTTHFQGQTIPGADLKYGASWPSWPNRPIFKVKRSPEKVNPPFCRYSCDIVHEIFGDLEFLPHFCHNLTWTSVKTISIELVGTHSQNDPFSRSNDPRSRTLPMDLVRPNGQNGPFSRSKISGANLTYGANWPSRPKWPILRVKRSPEKSMGFLVIHNFDLIFAIILPGRPLKPYLWSQLALTAITAHFKSKMILEAVHGIFGDPEFRLHFYQNFTWTSIKTLPMVPVDPQCQNGPFSKLNDS